MWGSEGGTYSVGASSKIELSESATSAIVAEGVGVEAVIVDDDAMDQESAAAARRSALALDSSLAFKAIALVRGW